MTATNHTEHYDLSQFVNTDHPTFTGDYNGDMSKIDAAIYAASQSGGPVGLSAVSHDATLTGDGTSTTPLRVADGTALRSISARAVDLNTYENDGLYHLTGVCQNTPRGNVDTNGILFVQRSGSDRFQVLIASWINGDTGRIYLRTGNKNTVMAWADWLQVACLADIPDISALASRIAALESQVAALTDTATPASTGLTAEQLDSQYLSGYNIVRVGTPTRGKETEEYSQ